MLDFLKNLFRKQEKETEKVKPDDMKQWFDGKVNQLEAEIKQKLSMLKSELVEKINSAESSLKILQDAKLRNTKISVREIQFAEGNRRSYLQRTAFLLREIRDIIDYEIAFFLHHYEEYIDNFAKSTEKAYRILQEFFADEAGKIAQAVKDIDNVVEKLKNDEQIHSYSRIEKIKKGFISLENNMKKKDELTRSIKEMKEQLSRLKEEESSLLKKRHEIMSSEDYKSYLDILDKKKKLELEIKSMKDSLYDDFSPLDRPLRKYQRIAYQDDKLIEHYTTAPLNALHTDFSLKIVGILEGLARNITENKLTLKDKQSEKALAAAKKMNRNYFTNFLNRYNTYSKGIEDLNKAISGSLAKQEFDKVDEKVNKSRTTEKDLKSRISLLQDELDSIDIANMREKLRSEIGQFLRVRIEFV